MAVPPYSRGRATGPKSNAGSVREDPMKISTLLSYAGGFRQAAAEVTELEAAGLDLVWVAEA